MHRLILRAFRDHWKLLVIPVLLDIIFLYALVFLQYRVLSAMSYHIEQLSLLIADNTAQLTESGLSEVLKQTPAFTAHYHSILQYVGLFMLIALGAWLLTQGIGWYIARYTVTGETNAKHYFLRFTGFTLVWFVIFLFSLFLVASIAESNTVLPFFGSYDTLIVTVLLLIVLSYFAYMTYSIPQWKALRHGLRRFWPLFLLYLASVGLTGLFIGLSSTIFTLHWSLLLIFIVAILIPSFTFYKVGFVAFALQDFQSQRANDKKEENK